MKRQRRRAILIAFGLFASLAPAVVITAPAQAACPVEYYYETTGNIEGIWIGTNVSSIWTQGPATISYTTSEAATAGSDTTVGVSVSVGSLIVKAEGSFSHSWSESTTHTESWRYDISIPRNVTARARVYKKGHKIEFRERKIGSDCIARYTKFWLRAPLSGNDNSNYCIVRDSYPGTKYIGKCANH